MRYLRWGGDGEAVQLEKCSGVENCLKNGAESPASGARFVGRIYTSDKFYGEFATTYNPITVIKTPDKIIKEPEIITIIIWYLGYLNSIAYLDFKKSS